MPFFNPSKKTKWNIPITTIHFNGSTDAELTASDKNNADFVKRVLRTLVLTSGTDGEKKLDLSVKMTEEGIKIIISGNDFLSVLKKLSRTTPPTFNQDSVKKINEMCQQNLPHISQNHIKFN